MRPSLRSACSWLLLLLPVAAIVAFVVIFARPLPLTDEWFYVRGLRRLHDVDWSTLDGWRTAARVFPGRFREHRVLVPFFLYAPLAEATGYDGRWAIALTVAAFAAQAMIYRSAMVRSAAALLPLALVLFCPSHYMEFLWGWQITLTLSVAFPLAGLAVLGRMSAASGRERWWRFSMGLLLILMGVGCSAGAFFGFPAALILVWLSDLDRRTRWRAFGVGVAVTALAYVLFLRGGAKHLALGWRELMYVCTALGATLWGSPVGLDSFGLDLRSAGGAALLVLAGIVSWRAASQRALPRVAVPLAIAAMGILCMLSIAMARPYLGNWHVQYALPATCGIYAAAYALRSSDRSRWATVSYVAVTALLASSVVGYVAGFTRYGPEYHRYVRSIEDYAFRDLTEPGRPAPYPEGAELGARQFLFLAAHGNPLFAEAPALRPAGPLPEAARVFRDDVEVGRSSTLRDDGGRVSLLTVALPGPATAAAVQARFGDQQLRLWRVHPQHVPEAARVANATLFMAVLVPHRLPPGEKPVAFDLLD